MFIMFVAGQDTWLEKHYPLPTLQVGSQQLNLSTTVGRYGDTYHSGLVSGAIS